MNDYKENVEKSLNKNLLYDYSTCIIWILLLSVL